MRGRWLLTKTLFLQRSALHCPGVERSVLPEAHVAKRQAQDVWCGRPQFKAEGFWEPSIFEDVGLHMVRGCGVKSLALGV